VNQNFIIRLDHNKNTSNHSRWRRFKYSRFVEAINKNPFASIGIIIIFVFLLISLFPFLFTDNDPIKLEIRSRLLPPSAEHPFGTDMMGMDIYARVIYGAQLTLRNIFVVMGIAVGIGLIIGSVAGFFGHIIEEVLMRFTDIFLAFPSLILAIAVNAVLGRGFLQTMLAVGFSWWPGYARTIRGQILSVKYDDFIVAANSMGASEFRVLTKHILPNCFVPVLVRITLDSGFVALTTASLSFLGMGAELPAPEWGRMVADGRNFLLNEWWVSTFPGLALFLVVVGFNLFGEIIRDWLDPSRIGR